MRRLMARATRVVWLSLHPLPIGFDLWQAIVSLGGSIGAGALIAQTSNFAHGALAAAGFLCVLLFIAAFRLQSAIDRTAEKKALIVTGTSHDQGFVRLVVMNPNSFSVRDAYVQLDSIEAREGTHLDLPRPSKGYRFPWTSWATEAGSLKMPLTAGEELPVDIAARPIGNEPPDLPGGSPTFFFVHMVPAQDGRTQRPVYLQARGCYRLFISLASADLPVIGHEVIDVEFDDQSNLTMRIVK